MKLHVNTKWLQVLGLLWGTMTKQKGAGFELGTCDHITGHFLVPVTKPNGSPTYNADFANTDPYRFF